MKFSSCLILIVVAFGLGFFVLFGLAIGLSGLGSSQGESPAGELATGGDDALGSGGPSVDAGPLSGGVPSYLRPLFIEAGGAVGVPAALLAAVSNQECGRLWSLNSEQSTRLGQLVEKNEDFPLRQRSASSDLGHMSCAYDNGSNVWGPMQFQFMTFYGYPRCRSRQQKRCILWEHNGRQSTAQWGNDLVAPLDSPINPTKRPIPLAGTAGGQASGFTRKSPASIINLKDSIYAAAIKLRADAGRGGKPKSAEWSRTEISRAACAYYGRCRDKNADYFNEVAAKYDKLRAADPELN